MATRRTLGVIGIAWLAACSGPGTTPSEIAARETVLLESPVRFGRIADVDTSWESGTYRLVLTPASIFVLGDRYTQIIPYLRVDDVRLAATPVWNSWPFGQRQEGPQALTVESEHAHCWHACVFDLGSAELNARAVALVRDRRAALDPFGRIDAGRRYWLVTTDTINFHGWQAGSRADAPARQALADGFGKLFDAASTALVASFNNRLSERLSGGSGSPAPRADIWQAVPRNAAPGDLEAHQWADMEPYRSNWHSTRQAPLFPESGIDRSLMARITHIDYLELPPGARVPGVAVTFHVELLFLDVGLMNPGRRLTLETSIVRSVPEWQRSGRALLEGAARTAADLAASRVTGLLEGRAQ